MILAHNEIRAALESGAWTAHRDGRRIGSDELQIGSNSVDVTLAGKLLLLDKDKNVDLHTAGSAQFSEINFPYAQWLIPGEFYLGCSRERFESNEPLQVCGRERYFVQMLETRSTVARVGMEAHNNAGVGDYGFASNWVFEIRVQVPTLVYVGDRIAQIIFDEVSSPHEYSGAYSDQHDKPREPVLGKSRFRRFV